MEFDEWSQEHFDEWEEPAEPEPPSQGNEQGKFPEVVIGSSSDEDAPPVPESTQLARENLALRSRISALMSQTKHLEMRNEGLKDQLSKYRSNFKNQVKTAINKIWK